MPVETYTTYPDFIKGINGGFSANKKGAVCKIIKMSPDGVTSMTIYADQDQLDILKANGHAV